MRLNTTYQAYLFLAAVYGGLCIGLIYDVYRAVRMITKPGKWLVAILDLSFWVLAAFVFFYMLYRINDGEIRLYIIIGLTFGWGIYILGIGSLVVKTLVKTHNIVKRIVLWPMGAILKLSRRIIGKIPKREVKKGIKDEKIKV